MIPSNDPLQSVESAINAFKTLNSSKERYVHVAGNGQIILINDKQLASTTSEINSFVRNKLLTIKTTSENKFLLFTEVKKYYSNLVKEFSKQTDSIQKRANPILAPKLHDNNKFPVSASTIKNTLEIDQLLEIKVKDLVLEQEKEKASKLKKEFEKAEHMLRDKALKLCLKLAASHPLTANQAKKGRPVPSIPKRLFNFALKDEISNSEMETLNKKYKSNYPLHQSKRSASYALSFLNRILFDKNFSFGVQTMEELQSLTKICQNRQNVYQYNQKFAQVSLGELQTEKLVSDLQQNIDHLEDPTSDRVVALKDGKSTSFILPGGWNKHYVSYEFRKEGNDYFFIVHNRGEHASDTRLHGNLVHVDGVNSFRKTTVRIKTTKEGLKDPVFLEKLITSQTTFGKLNPIDHSLQAYDSIYNHFINSKKGTIEQSELEKQAEGLYILIMDKSKANPNSKEVRDLLLQFRDLKRVIVNQNKCYQTVQLWGTCTESNYVTAEEGMFPSRVLKSLQQFTRLIMVNQLSNQILSGKFSHELNFIKLLDKHVTAVIKADSYVDMNKRDASANLLKNLEARPLTAAEKAPFITGLKEGKLKYQYLPKILKKDPEIAEAAVTNDGLSIKYVPKETESHMQLCFRACLQNIEAFNFISVQTKKWITDNAENRLIVLSWVDFNGSILKILPKYSDDIEIVKAAVKQNGLALQYASDKLKNNWEVAKLAIEQNPKAILYASDSIKNAIKTDPEIGKNKALVMAYLELDPMLLQYVSYELKCDPQVIMKAMTTDLRALKFANINPKDVEPFLVELVKRFPLFLAYLSKYNNNKNIALAAVKANGEALEFVSKDLQDDKEVVLEALKTNPLTFLYASPRLKTELSNDVNVMLKAVKYNGEFALSKGSEAIKDNVTIVEAAVRNNGLALEHASKRLRSDIGMVNLAIRENPDALKFASEDIKIKAFKKYPELRNNKPFVIAMIRLDPSMLQHASDLLKNDEDVVTEAIERDGLVLRFASPLIQNNLKIVWKAILQNPDALAFTSHTIQDAINDLSALRLNVLAWVKTNGMLLKNVKKVNLLDDREVIEEAVKTRGLALQYASDNLKMNFDVVMLAIKQDPRALKFAHKSLQKDPRLLKAAFEGLKDHSKLSEIGKDKEFMLLLLEEFPLALEYTSIVLSKDKEVVMKAISKNGLALEHAHHSLFSTIDIVQAAIKQNPEAIKWASRDIQEELGIKGEE